MKDMEDGNLFKQRAQHVKILHNQSKLDKFHELKVEYIKEQVALQDRLVIFAFFPAKSSEKYKGFSQEQKERVNQTHVFEQITLMLSEEQVGWARQMQGDLC